MVGGLFLYLLYELRSDRHQALALALLRMSVNVVSCQENYQRNEMTRSFIEDVLTMIADRPMSPCPLALSSRSVIIRTSSRYAKHDSWATPVGSLFIIIYMMVKEMSDN